MQFALCEFKNCCLCNLYLTVRQTMHVRVNPKKYSCLVALMFSPTSRPNPTLHYTRLQKLHGGPTYTRNPCVHYDNASLPVLEIPPDIWMLDCSYVVWSHRARWNNFDPWLPLAILGKLSMQRSSGWGAPSVNMSKDIRVERVKIRKIAGVVL
jgi:hypothetical protein